MMPITIYSWLGGNCGVLQIRVQWRLCNHCGTSIASGIGWMLHQQHNIPDQLHSIFHTWFNKMCTSLTAFVFFVHYQGIAWCHSQLRIPAQNTQFFQGRAEGGILWRGQKLNLNTMEAGILLKAKGIPPAVIVQRLTLSRSLMLWPAVVSTKSQSSAHFAYTMLDVWHTGCSYTL